MQLKNIYDGMITHLSQQHILDREKEDCGGAFERLKRGDRSLYGVSASAGIGEKGETGDGVTVQIRLTQVVKKGKGEDEL